ncbi:MAG: DUF4129 domain-containing protein [Bacteroidia bacterium]
MKILLLIFLFFISIAVSAIDKKNVLTFDTSKAVSIKRVSVEKEKEIFSDKGFIYHKEAKASKGWWDSFIDWLLSLLGKPVAKHPDLSYKLIKYVFIGLFIIGVIFILWKSKFIGLLKSNTKKLQGASFSDIPENIESINIEAIIDEALRDKNYRLALRWCFLKSLQWLNKQDKIAWQPSKTNVDYQQELKDKHLKENFIGLSHVFEYVWYGETTPTEKLCLDYKNRVEKFILSANV